MNKLIATVVVSSLLVSSAAAEIVVTTDGRKIELTGDGTYKIVPDEGEAKISMVEETPFFEFHAGQYGQNSMRFMPIFKNETAKTIVGFKFQSEFRNAFGEEIFSFAGDSSERIEDGRSSTASTFYFFEDNQFISGEPFDKLKIFESTNTGKILSRVTAVVFEDGEVLKE